MFSFLKKIFGSANAVSYAEIVKKGGIIIDVRTKGEYAGGHIKGSMNIPVDQLHVHVEKLKGQNKPIITCCASGMRSASAKRILTSSGIQEVYNGGGWSSLKSKLSR